MHQSRLRWLIAVCPGSLRPGDGERSKDRQTKSWVISFVIIAIMAIYVLTKQLDICNQQMQ